MVISFVRLSEEKPVVTDFPDILMERQRGPRVEHTASRTEKCNTEFNGVPF